jgi:hypothetical protein
MKSGNLNLLEPSGPLQACNRTEKKKKESTILLVGWNECQNGFLSLKEQNKLRVFWKKGLRRIFVLNWEKDEDGENYINSIFKCFALRRNLLRYSSGMEAGQILESSVRSRKPEMINNALKTKLRPILEICRESLLMNIRSLQKCWRKPNEILLHGFAWLMSSNKAILRHNDFSLHTPRCVLFLRKIG